MGNPWLTIIGIGEDGLAGLSEASRKAIAEAETVFGGERHLALAGISEPRPSVASAVRRGRCAELPRSPHGGAGFRRSILARRRWKSCGETSGR